MAALHAYRRSATFGQFRKRLEAAGKPVKAARMAAARKLFTVSNVMLAAGADFAPDAHA
ncbi:hypothetical protein [Blastochloris viridis]|uniref:hypothetical protein n=1 Tax=Blastochloris viridis TaxID=1079 RepID=UPI0012E11F70|nr:hypothetical protein [Blastochloris viridis]